MVLLLFDIDGTLLLRAADAHKEAMHAALRRIWRVRDPGVARVDTAGRTDPEIARIMLAQLGVSADRVDARMADFKHLVGAEYARLVPADLSETVAPGVPELLARLREREDVRLALVTGNLQPVARLKLERAGIGSFFERGQGGFGSDHEDRSELPAIARHRAGSDGGPPYPRERTVVIGDTPRDVACARADGVRCVSVATGSHGVQALRDADAVARTAHDLEPLLDRVAG